ncbi:GNAT family N-acetyltransferase [Fusobacterium russii]|uniref:GNAT family N-acetyltransferase n=1 Tax=Fusobacterium russii TaxID=854 RepID=UPI00039EEF32|nr:GNAT family N-acetyltransferase [Fusobacterium russii]
MIVRYGKENEKKFAIEHWKNSFKDSNEQIEFYFNNIFNHKNYLILEKDKKIISSLHENPYILNFNNNEIKTKYIVGVSTPIEEQRKGYMTHLLTEMLKNSKEKNYPFIFLTPINPNIYRKFGFEYFSKIENFKLKIEDLKNFKIDRTLNFYEIDINNKDKYLNDLIFIYNKAMKTKFLYLKRDEYYFNKLLLECFNDGMKIFISYKNNEPQGYIFFSKTDNEIEVRELFSIDFKIYESLLALLYFYKDYYQELNISTASNSNIEYIFENQLKIKKTEYPFMMMRVLKPLEIFKLLDIKIENLKIQIEDEIFKDNTGLYLYNKKWQYSSKSVADYDFKININDFTSLVTGFFSFDEMLFMKKIELNINKKVKIEKLREIFKRKQNYLYEFQ